MRPPRPPARRNSEFCCARCSSNNNKKTEELERLRVVVAKVENARVEGDELINQLTLARNNTYSRLVAELDAAADEAGLESRERAYDPDPIEGAEEIRRDHGHGEFFAGAMSSS